MSFPDVTLATPYVGQVAYESSTVKIIKLDDDAYTVDWTNQNIVDAVTAFFTV